MTKEKIDPEVASVLETPPITTELETKKTPIPEEIKEEEKTLNSEETKKEEEENQISEKQKPFATIVILNDAPSLLVLCVKSIEKFLNEKNMDMVVISGEEVDGCRTIVTNNLDLDNAVLEAVADSKVSELFIVVSTHIVAVKSFNIFDLALHKEDQNGNVIPSFGMIKQAISMQTNRLEWQTNNLVLPVVSTSSNAENIAEYAKNKKFLWIRNESNRGAIEFAESVVYEGENKTMD
jgi:hypothetical protein